MIDWKKIDTVLLDMDGTLLNLYFDNHFWQEFVPLKFAEKHGLLPEAAKQQLIPRFKSMEGRLEWYCLDYWSKALELDIAALKVEVSELIAVLPHATEFLEAVSNARKRVLLVTNAHRDSLALKMRKTGLDSYFDDLVSSHDFGFAKENDDFWRCLKALHQFDPATTLLIDDSPSVLNAARRFGLRHLVAVSKPDSRQPARTVAGYLAIEDFRAMMAGL